MEKAVKSMPSGRTPGCDGLRPIIYVLLWKQLGPLLLNAINYACSQKELHLSARRGVINLIPKKDTDVIYLKNWRPITLLNMDFKILAKVLATRMQSVLELLKQSQTGFVKNRSTAYNI